ncbi:MAG TPA: DUF3300 domain-containing protein [Gemmatimonadaceae bacterium]|nr:DUF3300 domain-containing protein [Gemmatimonadaceae bacterium]
MRNTLSAALTLSLVCAAASERAAAQVGYPAMQPVQNVPSFNLYTAPQLDNLLAPVALYPDALLAQVLVAATFPDQINEAARWVRSNGPIRLDDQWWDVSVRAVAHYPTVLNMMSGRSDWTTSLGQAYVMQSTDVMVAVQRLRAMAYSQGNLVSTPEQQVIVQDRYVEIVPAQPEVIYVPVYDPTVIYFRRAYWGRGFGAYWAFGSGFPIGAWLAYDCDWRERHVYYDGWRGGGWRDRARSHFHLTDAYVDPRYENVRLNRDVIRRQVDVHGISDYNTVHRHTTFDGRGFTQPGSVSPENPANNAAVDRRGNARNAQVNDRRGWGMAGRQDPRVTAPMQPVPRVAVPIQPAPVNPAPVEISRPPRQAEQPAPMQHPRPYPTRITPRPVPVYPALPTIETPERAAPARASQAVPTPSSVPVRTAQEAPHSAPVRTPQIGAPPHPSPESQQQPRLARPEPGAAKRPQ